MTTLFDTMQPKFVAANDKLIKTCPFLDAATQTTKIYDKIGVVMKPAKLDVEGNITKLRQKCEIKPELYETFYAMIEDEVKNDIARNKDSASLALLWLLRGMEFQVLFLREIVKDHKSGAKNEDMSGHCQTAYEQSLRPYHGMLARGVFYGASKMIPYRKDFLGYMMESGDYDEEKVITDMETYVDVLWASVVLLKQILEEFDLNIQDKV